MPAASNSPTLVAVDIGNSRIKLGRFAWSLVCAERTLPEPLDTLELALSNREGDFDAIRLAAWCGQVAGSAADWWISSVHRGAAERLSAAVAAIGKEVDGAWSVRQIRHSDVRLAIEVDAPERVGMDRLLGAVAANRLRAPDQGAIVVDLGTATKVDLVTAAGAFAGGAILPGLEMSARALAEQTDALPLVAIDHWRAPPTPLGKSTVPAIEAGLFWGAVGAIHELVARLSADLALRPEVYVSGGAAELVAEVLGANDHSVHHLPHLVLSGVALTADESL